MIRPAALDDAARVAAIYNRFIAESVVTFEEQPVSTDEMQRRVTEVMAAGRPWLVAETNGTIAGYAYAKPWHTRSAYRLTLESTIYLAPEFARRGLGTRLYEALIAAARGIPCHSLVGCIALPNPASIALHEKLGFRPVGVFKEVGWKFGRWIDVGYWQLMV